MSDNKSEIKTEEDYKYEVSHAPTPHIVHVKKSPTKKILVGILIFVLIGACGYLGYAYFQEKQNSDILKSQLNDQTQFTQQTDQEPSSSTSEQTVYSAKVGKFSLSLPSSYAIIVNIDGGYEGGPATEIDIGIASDDYNVIDGNNGISGVTISARPHSGYTGSDLEDYISSTIGENPQIQQKENINIDGVQAKYYGIDGLTYDEYIIFENKNIFYDFKIIDAQSDKNQKTTIDLIAGFKFN